jgi:acyl-CoA synthetase (AMP-forming)/AMP-acid ligase II
MLGRDAAKAAIIMAGSGERVSFATLVANTNRAAQLLRSLGLKAGDCIAICMENNSRYFELCWAAHNAGLYYTPISSRLKSSEVAYIVADCGARVLFASSSLREVAVAALQAQRNTVAGFMICGASTDSAGAGFTSYEQALALLPAAPPGELTHESVQGTTMMYSSGTTGAPKGIKPPLSELPVEQLAALPLRLRELYGFDAGTVYLSPAPLYHAAPLKFCLAVLAAGGTVVVMEKFDAEHALRCIQEHRITHSQWVPTMFSRLLKLPDEVRQRYKLSSQRLAIHSAAPCSIEIKEQMLQWWGPIVHEYYSGSESIGMCAIGPEEWLLRKGSVGKAARGIPHVLGESGEELPPGSTGLIYFETATTLRYHNDPQKTARAHNDKGWATMGDVGYIDADGYIYLTDRRDFVIISGGVNIYPQEGEAVLAAHPSVSDVAMFGVPNEDFGEEVKAVVVPQQLADAGPGLEKELIDFCRGRLSSIKCPRTIDFVSELPREPTGKLLKKQLRQRYWDEAKIMKAPE